MDATATAFPGVGAPKVLTLLKKPVKPVGLFLPLLLLLVVVGLSAAAAPAAAAATGFGLADGKSQSAASYSMDKAC